jgi:hypothetical protein
MDRPAPGVDNTLPGAHRWTQAKYGKNKSKIKAVSGDFSRANG